MMRLKEFIDGYQGEEQEELIPPELPDGTSKIVMVTLDEATFFLMKLVTKCGNMKMKAQYERRYLVNQL